MVNRLALVRAGFAGMLLVSPVVALVTLVIFAGWVWFTREHKRISWMVLLAGWLFYGGLFLFAWALNRTGNYGNTPLDILVNWTKEVGSVGCVSSGAPISWLQKLFQANRRYGAYRSSRSMECCNLSCLLLS